MTNGTQAEAGPLTPIAGAMRTGFTPRAGVPGRQVSGQRTLSSSATSVTDFLASPNSMVVPSA
jgi:hypothetical protein